MANWSRYTFWKAWKFAIIDFIQWTNGISLTLFQKNLVIYLRSSDCIEWIERLITHKKFNLSN